VTLIDDVTVVFDEDAVDMHIVFASSIPSPVFFDIAGHPEAADDDAETWTLYDPTAGAEVDGLLSVSIQDAFNRFARTAEVTLDDTAGALAATYAAGTPLQVKIGGTVRFGGFVSCPTTDRYTTTLELLGFDFWLKKRVIYYTFNGATISAALEYLIETYTPLTWNPALVQVVNDATFTREWKGTALNEVVAELSSLSAGEEFGADDEGVFFFRPRSANRSPRDFTEGEYAAAEFDEDAKAEVNRVVIYYGEYPTTGAIALENKASQKALQEQFGSSNPVVIEVTRTYPEITTEAGARSKAQQILDEKSAIQTGELSTWESYDVRPGDVCTVVDSDQGIDGEFRIAQIGYEYPGGETTIRLAENAEGVVDVLVELSDEVSRIDARAADTDATLVEMPRLDETIGIEVLVEVYTYDVPDDALMLGEWQGQLGEHYQLGDRRAKRTQVP